MMLLFVDLYCTYNDGLLKYLLGQRTAESFVRLDLYRFIDCKNS